MVSMLARNWWALALRGVFAIIFGILAFIWPDVTLTALVLLFGAYALVDGVFSIIAGVMQATQRRERWWVLVLEGLLGVAAGVATLIWPDITAFILLYLIAAWAVVTGIMEIIAAIRLRKEIEGEFWLALAGIVSILFGILLFVFPGTGALAVVWMIGAYGVAFGVAMLIVAFRLRSWGKANQQQFASMG
ncbi:MAG: HdeD family acid-resistance protein [Chloroflexi bacterium]|nr:HdeD family acid-resistance protein [Chloroflexota bacterium]